MEKPSVPFSQLPDEIWVEIFRKLPLRFLSRCLVGCKQWHNLISNPIFRSNYNPNHPPSLLIKIQNHGFNYIITDPSLSVGRPYHPSHYSSNDFFRTGFVLGSCNGLIALHRAPRSFLLFNPLTKHEKHVRANIPIPNLALWLRWHLYGLFHDPSRDEYKAVICNPTGSFVVSLRDGSFKSILDRSQLLQKVDSCGKPTVFRGVPHWVCSFRFSKENVIVYFDLVTGGLEMVEFPEASFGRWREFGVGVLDGKLSVTLQVDSLDVEVWALNEYGERDSWRRLFVIPSYYIRGPMRILSRMNDDEILISGDGGKSLVMYDVRNQSPADLLPWTGSHEIVTYIPSLVSPNTISDDA